MIRKENKIKVLGYIPARSGSKGVLNKNIKPISGVPLLEFSVFSAVEAKKEDLFSEVILSTDSDYYLSLVKNYDIEKDYIRPSLLAKDNSATIDGIKDALYWLKKFRNISFDAVMTLQPTSPFRTTSHIRKAIELMSNNKKATSVVSIARLNHHHPRRIKKMMEGGRLDDFCCDFREIEPSRRQDLEPEAYIRNGAIYLTKTDSILSKGYIQGPWVIGMEMNEANSVNIDNELDYLVAQASIEHHEYKEDLSFFNKLIQKRN